MADKKEKLTPEQIKQIQMLQQMMQQGQGGGAVGGKKKKFTLASLKNISAKSMFISFLQTLQNGVKFVDQFINFVVRKESDTTNDVIQNARAPILFGTFVLVFFVFFGMIWAAFAPLDSAAHAMGTVISSTQKKTINHQEGGIIKKIYVKLGDTVQQGDKLIEFDDTRIRSEYENNLNQYRALTAAEARLLAEINEDEEISYPIFLTKDKSVPEVAKIIETQDNLFKSKIELRISEKDSLKQRIKQAEKQIEGYHARLEALKKTLAITKDRLEAKRELNKKGYAQKAEILELESKEASTESDISMTETEIARTEQEITKIEIELINLDNKGSAQALTELKDVQANLADRRERYFYYQEALKRTVVESPVTGVVNNINFHTIGSTIPQGQPIMEISPTEDKMVIEARIDPKNIDSVQVGLVAKMRFTAFKNRTTPLFTGTVTSLSPDIIVDPRAAPGQPGGSYYLARIEIDMDYFNKIAEPRQLKLQTGMQADVQIVTGTRTLLQYLLDPIRDAMFKGFKEK